MSVQPPYLCNLRICATVSRRAFAAQRDRNSVSIMTLLYDLVLLGLVMLTVVYAYRAR